MPVPSPAAVADIMRRQCSPLLVSSVVSDALAPSENESLWDHKRQMPFFNANAKLLVNHHDPDKQFPFSLSNSETFIFMAVMATLRLHETSTQKALLRDVRVP